MPPQIIGIVLVKNEDLFIRDVLRNIEEFCDRIIVADNRSTDGTLNILKEFAERSAKYEVHCIDSPAQSHGLLKKYINTPAWVFGVDGDEIYDPGRLRTMRQRLLAGEFDRWWMVFGNVLNCDVLDRDNKTASGFLSPPSRSITKLYNFSLIRSWDGDTPERLHGGELVFHEGHSAGQRYYLYKEIPWEQSDLRCLHTCFMHRSSLDGGKVLVRENIMESHRPKPMARLKRWWKKFKGEKLESKWKKSRYARGERVTIDISPFFG